MPILTTSPSFLKLASLLLLILGSLASEAVLHATAQQCQGDLQGLMTECAVFVQKLGPIVDPSQACCGVIKKVDIPCVCRYITEEIEQMINMEKVVHVAAFCGKPLPRGTKCGSYTVPP